jgi:hypothetical protein
VDPRIEAILNRGKNRPPVQPVQQTPRMTSEEFVSNRVLNKHPLKKSEIQRITNLPIADPLSDDEIDAINDQHVKPEAAADGFRLQRVQAEALQIFSEQGGLFAPIEVGGGKTLIGLRAVGIAIEQGLKRVMMFVPPQVYSQLVNHDIAQVRRWVPLGCSFYLLGGKSPAKRKQMAGGRRGCWVMPYSLLSRPDSFELLEQIRPDLMIFDEAHNLKNRGAARTKRIMTYWRRFRPHVVAMSGTMTSKSLNDYAHLLLMCLRDGAPVPLDANTVQEWAATIDSEQKQTEAFHGKKTGPGPLRPLIVWSNKNFPKEQLDFTTTGFRSAFMNRLMTTPGVVASPADSLGVSLVIENERADKMASTGGALLQELTDQLEEHWVSPCGDEIEHAMLIWKWNSELSAGIYNSLIWPDEDALAGRLNIRSSVSKDLLERSKSYHSGLQYYHKELRTWFRNYPHRPGLDTPMLIGGNMARYGHRDVGEVLYKAWKNKNDLKGDDIIERDKLPVRVCDYKIKMALKWAQKQEDGGIVWFHHKEVGLWLNEVLTAAGLPVIYCPAGKAANQFLTSPDAAEKCAGKILICSISSHGTGKNLQFMQNQLFAQLPISEMAFEQAIGRTHRKGQEADEIYIGTLVTSTYDEMALSALLNDALYVRETMNSPRKILIASWNPMPIIYGSAVLIRAGAQANMLNARQQQQLQERFQKNET